MGSKRFFVIAAGFVASSLLGASDASTFKIGFVDIQKAMHTVDSGKKAKAQIEKEMNAKRESLEKLQASLQKEIEEFEKKAAVMNETARAKKNAELQKKAAEFQKSYQESQMALQKRERDLTAPIITEMKAIVEGIGKAQGMHLVLEKNEGAVLYAQGGRDLTDDVIKAFNNRKKK